jgi:hypothetical protein
VNYFLKYFIERFLSKKSNTVVKSGVEGIAKKQEPTAMRTVLDTLKLTEIFICCDDFCKDFQHHSLQEGYEKEIKPRQMQESEIMTILIYYHHSGMKCFKYYYEQIITKVLRSYWKKPYAYEAFVAQIPRVNLLLFAFLAATRLATTTEANYIDSTPLVVCHNRRKQRNKTFQNIARTGKTSTGWFFGFKLHAIINQKGQLVVLRITTGNVADNNGDLLQQLTQRIKGFLYGDKGYLTQLAQKLKARGVEIITKYRKKMGLQALTYKKSYYLRHRGLIETVFDCLKNRCDLEHTRHRTGPPGGPINFLVNIWSALIAYTFFDQ